MPTITLSLKIIGDDVPVSPLLGSPFFTDQTTLPVLASRATSVVSAWCRKILPSAYDTPRFTVSQHITGMTFGSCFGSYFQTILFSSLRLSAWTVFGNGAWTYIKSPMTSGPPSWPRSTPVENVHATCNLPTLAAVIWLSFE